MRIETQPAKAKSGDAVALLVRLCELVDEELSTIGVTPSDVRGRPASDGRNRSRGRARDGVVLDAEPGEFPHSGHDDSTQRQTPGLRPEVEPSDKTRRYVSYAWGDNQTEMGRARDAAVALLVEAEQRGIQILRDQQVMQTGDSISAFMAELARGACIYVIISEKYLYSPYCMYELHEIYRVCQQDSGLFRDRIRPFTLPCARFGDPLEPDDLQEHWEQELAKVDARIKKRGAGISRDLADAARMLNTFTHNTADILRTVADTLHPQGIEAIEQIGRLE